jgi:hypothetical protein
MHVRGILISAVLLSLLACGGGTGGGETDVSNGGASGSLAAVSTPTTANHTGSVPSAVNDAQPPETPAVESSSTIVDLEAHRIFLPSEGWLSADAFWDLYYKHPDRLPADIDFDAVNQLGPMPPAPTTQP